MRTLKFTVTPDNDNITVRCFVRNVLGFSARMLTKQKQVDGGILINGCPAKSINVLHSGDVLSFAIADEFADYQPSAVPINILYESDDHLVVDKPPNMPIHPSPGHDTDSLLNACAYYFQQTGQSCLFRPLYRLDKDTSGVLVLGKHRVAVSSVKAEKRYFAVCQGKLSGCGTVDVPIGLSPDSKIVRECGHGDSAVTHWRAIASTNGHTLISVNLETGRTHQIRAHMSHIGFPLAGDDLYGGALDTISRQALHCGWVKISCPVLSLDEQIFSEFPSDIRRAFPWLPSIREIIKEEE